MAKAYAVLLHCIVEATDRAALYPTTSPEPLSFEDALKRALVDGLRHIGAVRFLPIAPDDAAPPEPDTVPPDRFFHIDLAEVEPDEPPPPVMAGSRGIRGTKTRPDQRPDQDLPKPEPYPSPFVQSQEHRA